MMLKKILNKILDLVLPQKCLKCGTSDEILCEKCLPKLKRCHEFLGDNVIAVFSYSDNAVSAAIKLLKYRGIKIVAPSLAKFMREVVLEEISELGIMAGGDENEKVIVMPVPLHKERLAKRGFNQSEVIARNIIDSLNEEKLCLMPNILERIKDTESQVSAMSREKRLKNLKGAFFVSNPEKILGKVVILVDDVITTGATISECRKTLEKAGARKVIALIVAH